MLNQLDQETPNKLIKDNTNVKTTRSRMAQSYTYLGQEITIDTPTELSRRQKAA